MRVTRLTILIRNTWFSQSDVDELVSVGMNTVRIPVSRPNFAFPEPSCQLILQLGYWIVEALVDRKTEFFPRGGLKQLVSTR
jgi:hypothetical protein